LTAVSRSAIDAAGGRRPCPIYYLEDDERVWRLEPAIERAESRQPYLSDEFSLATVNERFRQDEHNVLMYQQY
jgi:hypothetical protein